jgi:glyoxylase-like metal-dependent hydrolase (beta-lactamase superfamily II)
LHYYLCETCGVQYERAVNPPASCLICSEERQYVKEEGQSWTTLEEMEKSNIYQNTIMLEEENLYSINTMPKFAIGQTAYLVQDENMNILWDCITYLDMATKEEIQKLGGIDAIILSHPHYYSTQIEWAEAFNAPIYIHEDDKEWVMRSSDRIIYWSGESLQIGVSTIVHRLGGHFKGGSVLEWRNGNDKQGSLLSGDIIQVVADPNWVSFMYSYPNLIPLPSSTVRKMADKVKDIKFNRLYNAFHSVVKENANEKVQKSAERYIAALEGHLFNT